jgi:hypothetical protein
LVRKEVIFLEEHIPFDEAIERLRDSRRQVHENLRLLVQSTKMEVSKENPLRREGFKRMLVEIFSTKPGWDRLLAESMAYNITSVRRWWTGPSCPHQALWPQIFKWFEDALYDLSFSD